MPEEIIQQNLLSKMERFRQEISYLQYKFSDSRISMKDSFSTFERFNQKTAYLINEIDTEKRKLNRLDDPINLKLDKYYTELHQITLQMYTHQMWKCFEQELKALFSTNGFPLEGNLYFTDWFEPGTAEEYRKFFSELKSLKSKTKKSDYSNENAAISSLYVLRNDLSNLLSKYNHILVQHHTADWFYRKVMSFLDALEYGIHSVFSLCFDTKAKNRLFASESAKRAEEILEALEIMDVPQCVRPSLPDSADSASDPQEQNQFTDSSSINSRMKEMEKDIKWIKVAILADAKNHLSFFSQPKHTQTPLPSADLHEKPKLK